MLSARGGAAHDTANWSTHVRGTASRRPSARISFLSVGRSVGRSSRAKRLNQRQSMTPEGDASVAVRCRRPPHPATAAAAAASGVTK